MTKNYIGNISTIAKTILLAFAGWMLGYCVSIGLNLPLTQEQLSEILFTILCFIVAYIDAKFPHTFSFLTPPIPEEELPVGEVVLNDEYITEPEGDSDDGC